MAVVDKIFSITHFLNVIVIVLGAASLVVAFLDIYKAAIAEKVEVANAQLKQLNKRMQLSLAHLYYVTLAFLGLWFSFLVVSVALKEHEAAGPGYICVAFVMLFIWLMDMVDTRLRKLKLLQSSIEVPLVSTIMMRAAMTAAERKQQHEESAAQKASRGADVASVSSVELHARAESSQEQHTFV